MSTPDEDKDLEDLLAGRSDLSRRYRASSAAGSQEAPPADLDRAILAQARSAVASPSATVSPLPVRNRIRWAVPFALAASVLLTFAIFREGNKEVGVKGDVATGVVTEQSVAPASAPVVANAVSGPEQEDRAVPLAVTRDEVARKAVESRAAPPVVLVSPPAEMAPVPAPAITLATAAPAVSENLAVTSGAVAPAPPPAAPATSTAVAARAPAAQRASAELARAEADAAKVERTPESWLEDVRKLRAAGQGVAADEELQRFLAEYPDYFVKNPGVARP
ncbi:MAG: hypothetical protein ABL964_14305 [Steroidobacteraceae bacterium]